MDTQREYLADMLKQYAETLLFIGLDYSDDTEDNPAPLDENYGCDDIADEAVISMMVACSSFLRWVWEFDKAQELSASDMGHNFALTRNHHGTGFWDRGLGDLGDKLTTAAHAFGEQNLYVGDDGLLYVD